MQQVDDPQMLRFTWRIENFSSVKTIELYSETFSVGGSKWRISLFPKGIGVDYLSIYLAVADSEHLPCGWSRYAECSLVLISHMDDKYSVMEDIQKQFNAEQSEWGFTSFLPLNELHDPSRGYLVDDTCIIEAQFPVHNIASTQLIENSEVEKEEKNLESFFSSLSSLEFAELTTSPVSGTLEKFTPSGEEIDKSKEDLQNFFGISFANLIHPDQTLILEKSVSTLVTSEILGSELQNILQCFKKDLPGLRADYIISSLSKAEIEEKLARVDSLRKKMAESSDCFKNLQTCEAAALEELKKVEEEISKLKVLLAQIGEKLDGYRAAMKTLHKKAKAIKDEYRKLKPEVPALAGSKRNIEEEQARIEKAWEDFKSQLGAMLPYVPW